MSRTPELAPICLRQVMPFLPHPHPPAPATPAEHIFFPHQDTLSRWLFLIFRFSASTSLLQKVVFPKYSPLIYVFIALKTFPFHSPCFVITHLIVFPPLMPPSPLNYKLPQYRNHICLPFALYPGPSPAPRTYSINIFE